MWATVRQNLIFFILILLTLNLVGLTAFSIVSHLTAAPVAAGYDIIDCGDATGRVHKCIRVDPKAGEVTNSTSGASYRVIYGH